MQSARGGPGGFEVEVFYDGDCPLCAREIRVLRRLDRRGRVRFTDIAAPGFDAAAHGKSHADFMRRMQARLADGTWVEGVETFRRLYAAVGFRWIAALSRAPGVAQALDLAYAAFAKNRLRLTGRCESDACAAPAQRG
jgi:predicted DCC family thiol-disulfide oxidoreductase YuxK